MRSSITDLVAGLFSLLIALAFYSQCGDLTGVSLMYPSLIIGFITLGGLYLLAQGLLKMRRGCDTIADDEPVALKRVAMISVISMAYVVLIPLLGFYSASALFLFGAAMVLSDMGGGPAKTAVAAGILTAVMCLSVWGGFALLLGVPTPEGMFF